MTARIQMRYLLHRAGFVTLVFAIVIQATWGMTLMAAPVQLNTTPMAFLLRFIGEKWLGAFFIVCAVAAVWALRHPGVRSGLWAHLPQNFLFLMGGTSAVIAIVQGHYPDGTIPAAARWFIANDQVMPIVFAVLHAVSLAFYHGRQWTLPPQSSTS